MDPQQVPTIVGRAVEALLDRREADAAELLRGIDERELEAEKVRAKEEARRAALSAKPSTADVAIPVPKGARNLTPRELVEVFVNDRFTCRFAHCQRRTIIPPVLRLLSVPFPDVLRYNKNWRGSHPVYWLFEASGDHTVPWNVSRSSDTAINVITACYWCNQVKSFRRNEILGWELADPPVESEWDGLSHQFPRLLDLLADRIPPENQAYYVRWRTALRVKGVETDG